MRDDTSCCGDSVDSSTYTHAHHPFSRLTAWTRVSPDTYDSSPWNKKQRQSGLLVGMYKTTYMYKKLVGNHVIINSPQNKPTNNYMYIANIMLHSVTLSEVRVTWTHDGTVQCAVQLRSYIQLVIQLSQLERSVSLPLQSWSVSASSDFLNMSLAIKQARHVVDSSLDQVVYWVP